MPAPTGPQFVRLYRGLHAVEPEHLEEYPQGIGPHWTKDSNVAYNFATNRDYDGTPLVDPYFPDEIPMAGTVVEALVNKRNIIDYNSPEGEIWGDIYGVFDESHPERETTVRPDSPLHIQQFHYFDDDKNKYRSVKPTRRKGYRA